MNNLFYPSMTNSKLSRTSHSQANFTNTGNNFYSLKGYNSTGSKKQIDNKIFENMLRN